MTTLGEDLLAAQTGAIRALDGTLLASLIIECRERDGDPDWGPDWEALWWAANEEAVRRYLAAHGTDDDDDNDDLGGDNTPDDVVPMPPSGRARFAPANSTASNSTTTFLAGRN